MPDESTEDTQKTHPKKGEPIEIPVPSKDQIMGATSEKMVLTAVDDEDEQESS